MSEQASGVAVPGLRERKKLMTRRALFENAQRLFEERGYDNVTVAEIADSANIAVKTLFTYVDSKEDLAFANEAGMRDALALAVRERVAGTSAIDAVASALRRMVTEAAAGSDEASLSGVEGYHRGYGDSVALRSRLRRMWSEFEDALTEAITETTPRLSRPLARLEAMQAIALVRLIASSELRTAVAEAKDPTRVLLAWIDRAKDRLDGAAREAMANNTDPRLPRKRK